MISIWHAPTGISWTLLTQAWTRIIEASFEAAAFTILAAAVIAIGRIRSPRMVASIWLLVLAKPMLTLLLGSGFSAYQVIERFRPGDASALYSMLVLVPFHSPSADAMALSPFSWLVRAAVLDFGGLLAAAWVIGATVSGVRLMQAQSRLREIYKASQPADQDLQMNLLKIAEEYELTAVPCVRMSSDLVSPAIIGFLRPMIVVPEWMTTDEHSDKLSWALRHELMHWRAGDTIANGLRQICLLIFFFHPFVKWAAVRWEEAIELACDRAIAETPEQRRAYANALFAILERSAVAPDLRTSLYAARSQIARRVSALLHASDQSKQPSTSRARTIAVIVLLALGFLAGLQIDVTYLP